MQLHERYGPVVRIAPNEVIVSDPSAIKTIYGHTSNLGKTKFYIQFGTEDNDDLFTDPNIARHAHHRREIAAAYSMTSLVELEPFVDECIRTICEKLQDLFVQGHRALDIASWLQFYAFDVSGGQADQTSQYLTISYCPGNWPNHILPTIRIHERGSGRTKLHRKARALPGPRALFTVVPEYWSLYYAVTALLSKLRLVYPPGISIFNEFVGTQIKDRLERGDEGQSDFVSRLQKMGRPESTIWRSCFANVAAGSDTTAISLQSIMYFLLRNPSAYRQLQEEIDTFSAEGKISE
ncbi:hypothetical protein ACJZ2D_009408 [Fusarium nematophilum]